MSETESPNNAFLIAQYLIYLSLSLPVTWAVGRTLYRNGAVFLIDAFKGKETLANSVNHLLVVGFYLINCGWVIRSIGNSPVAHNFQQIIENVAGQLGTIMLILGGMHFFNIYIFNRLRVRGEQPRPPVRPSEYVMPAARIQTGERA